MKKIIATCAFLLFVAFIFAQTTFTVDGIKYLTTSANTVAVTNGITYTGSITIPSTVVNAGITYSVTTIGDQAFYKCNSLTNVSIPNSIKTIGSSSFWECSNLTNLIIPNAVTTIKDYAFYDCRSLTNISIPNNVTEIGEHSFILCRNLTEINVQEGNQNFSSLNGVLFNKDQSSILAYPSAKSGVYVIPNSVKTIGNSAFSNCHANLTGITIPKTVTSIGTSAFWNCNGLVTVTIPNSVNNIGDDAFAVCYGLTSIAVEEGNPSYITVDGVLFNKNQSTLILFPAKKNANSYSIPSTVTSIGRYAFAGSTLTDIVIPSTVEKIGSSAFWGCRSLKKITYNRISVTDIDNYAFYDVNKTTCVLEVPIESINLYKNANNWKDFLSIVGIGTNYETKSINLKTSGTLSSVLTAAEKNLIKDLTISGNINAQDIKCMRDEMTKLSVIDLSNASIQAYNGTGGTASSTSTVSYPANELPESSFHQKTSLTSIKLPNTLTSVGKSAFYSCYGLTQIIIPEHVSAIGESAFSFCNSLADVTLSTSLNTIGESCFSSCSKLTGINIPNSVTTIGDYAFSSCSTISNLTIGNAVTTIGYNAFRGCKGLTSLTLPNSVTAIGNYSFSNCSGLTSVSFGNTIQTIGENAFSSCSKLTDITLPISVKSIGKEAFSWCSSLSSVSIPSSIIEICDGTFSVCGLTSIKLPNSIVKIGNSAFSSCSKLTNVDLPSSVTTIGNSAFSGCRMLPSVKIPSSVISIGESAFNYCLSITTFNVASDNTSYSSLDDVLFNKNKTILIAYPPAKIDHKYGIPITVDSIANSAFANCINLDYMEIPNSVTIIGNSAFSNCSILSHLVIPNSVTSIGNSAFSNCKGLTNIDIPNSIVSINESAFSQCSNLKELNLSKNITSIGNYAFYSCKGLTKITILQPIPPIIYLNTFGENSKDTATWDKSNCTLYVPIGSKSLYQSANYWKDFPNIVESNSSTPVYHKIAITLSAGGEVLQNNSNIKSGDVVEVLQNDGLSFSIFSAPEFEIDSVMYNGKLINSELSSTNTLILPPVTSDGTLRITFRKKTYRIAIKVSEMGTIDLHCMLGETPKFSFSALTGWNIHTVLYNGDDVTASIKNNAYILPAVSKNGTLSVVFSQISGVKSAVKTNVKVYANDGVVSVMNATIGANISIYNLNGVLLNSKIAISNLEQFNVASDAVYILKVGAETFKIIN